jgi:hypothetical protein
MWFQAVSLRATVGAFGSAEKGLKPTGLENSEYVANKTQEQ